MLFRHLHDKQNRKYIKYGMIGFGNSFLKTFSVLRNWGNIIYISDWEG